MVMLRCVFLCILVIFTAWHYCNVIAQYIYQRNCVNPSVHCVKMAAAMAEHVKFFLHVRDGVSRPPPWPWPWTWWLSPCLGLASYGLNATSAKYHTWYSVVKLQQHPLLSIVLTNSSTMSLQKQWIIWLGCACQRTVPYHCNSVSTVANSIIAPLQRVGCCQLDLSWTCSVSVLCTTLIVHSYKHTEIFLQVNWGLAVPVYVFVQFLSHLSHFNNNQFVLGSDFCKFCMFGVWLSVW